MNSTFQEIMKIPKLLTHKEKPSMHYETDKRYVFIGCGSSYNLGFITSAFLRKKGITSTVISSGDLLCNGDFQFNLDKQNDILIFISRTGETTETLMVEKQFNSAGFKTIDITCQKDSSLKEFSNEELLFDYAYEKSVVMTGSFVAILEVLQGQFASKQAISNSESILNHSMDITKKLNLEQYNHFVFLGYNELFGISKESALKFQEMALETVEYHEPLEYRHGPKSILSEETLVVFQNSGTEYEKKLILELNEQSPCGLLVIGQNFDFNGNYLEIDYLPLKIIPVQLMAYTKARIKELNPDQPQNLTKTVRL